MSTCSHSPYWRGAYGNCMVCRAEYAEEQLAEERGAHQATKDSSMPAQAKETWDALEAERDSLKAENEALKSNDVVASPYRHLACTKTIDELKAMMAEALKSVCIHSMSPEKKDQLIEVQAATIEKMRAALTEIKALPCHCEETRTCPWHIAKEALEEHPNGD